MLWKTLNAVLIAAVLMMVYVLLLSLSAHGAPYPDHSELRPTCRVVYSLTEPAVALPEAMCQPDERGNDIASVWMSGEVNGWWSRYDSPADVVGALGERGAAQIHPIHRERMASLGLDFGKERDRLIWAGILWTERGWSAWSAAR